MRLPVRPLDPPPGERPDYSFFRLAVKELEEINRNLKALTTAIENIADHFADVSKMIPGTIKD
jgi:hypothetical protein